MTPVLMRAKCNDTSSREGCDVDHRRRIEAPRIVQRVAQDEAAFRIGVQDFNGLARGAR